MILEEKFGFKSFRPGQKDIIQSVLNGLDVLAILPTGAGKTLCYQYPSKMISGLTIVVSPLLSLMEDQVHQLRAAGDKTVYQLNSMLTFSERKYVLSQLKDDSMLFISPEMLGSEYIQKQLKSHPVGLFVVDEAHCISQWGHEFRTDYLRLKEVRKALGSPPCLALTATATPEVEDDIKKELHMRSPVVHRFSVNRENIRLIVEEANGVKEKEQLFIKSLEYIETPAIIYTATRNGAIEIAEKLKEKGITNTAYYHGGMSKEDRLLVQYQFLKDELDIICATNAFGMGVNKSNIRTVVHLHLPSSAEQYIQEIGRAGRDGKQSSSVLFFTKEDRRVPLNFIAQEFPTENELKVWFQSGLHTNGRIEAEELKQIYRIDETRWKMLSYYLQKADMIDGDYILLEKINDDMLNRLNHHFFGRKKKKETRFALFEELVLGENCIRSAILMYFGEEPSSLRENCCSKCGVKLTDLKKGGLTSDIDKEVFSWDIQLKRMFFPTTDGGS